MLWLLGSFVKPIYQHVRFQELDLSAENFLLGSTPLEAFWEDHVAKTLNGVSKYSLVVNNHVSNAHLVGSETTCWYLIAYLCKRRVAFTHNKCANRLSYTVCELIT